MQPIEKAVAVARGQTRLARAIGVSPSFVSQWVTGQRPVPAKRCRAIEDATGGVVTRSELRPDVFGDLAERAHNSDGIVSAGEGARNPKKYGSAGRARHA